MPLLIRGESVTQAQTRAGEILERVGLDKRLRHKPSELSGGERQRAAIARALVTHPACVLADEPSGNLDRKNADQISALLLELNADLGTALIIVTHDEAIAGRMGRSVQIQDGRFPCRCCESTRPARAHLFSRSRFRHRKHALIESEKAERPSWFPGRSRRPQIAKYRIERLTMGNKTKIDTS